VKKVKHRKVRFRGLPPIPKDEKLYSYSHSLTIPQIMWLRSKPSPPKFLREMINERMAAESGEEVTKLTAELTKLKEHSDLLNYKWNALHSEGCKVNEEEQRLINEQIRVTDKEIDELQYRIYKLTPKEKRTESDKQYYGGREEDEEDNEKASE
jgi:uncharacterized coiled-coil DUF342 family protein